MICNKCAEAADGVDFGPVPVCPVCSNGPIEVNKDGTVRVHPTRGPRCSGAGKPPRMQTGHDFCNGCSCQHKSRGSWNQR